MKIIFPKVEADMSYSAIEADFLRGKVTDITKLKECVVSVICDFNSGLPFFLLFLAKATLQL